MNNKIWENVCGECRYFGKHWLWDLNYCEKINDRQSLFREENQNIDFIDAFRFSPDPGVRPGFKACVFFEKL